MKANLIKNLVFNECVENIIENIIDVFRSDYRIKKEFEDDFQWCVLKDDIESELDYKFHEDNSFEEVWTEIYNRVKTFVDNICELKEFK